MLVASASSGGITRSLPSRATCTTGSHRCWQRKKQSANREPPPYPGGAANRVTADSASAAAGMITAAQARTPGGHSHAASPYTTSQQMALIAITPAFAHRGMPSTLGATARAPATAPARPAATGGARYTAAANGARISQPSTGTRRATTASRPDTTPSPAAMITPCTGLTFPIACSCRHSRPLRSMTGCGQAAGR